MNEVFPYDAIETDDSVCFVVNCEAPPSRHVETRIVPGRGMELSCGRWLMRITNLHPRLLEACLAKPVSIAAIDQAGLIIRGPNGLQSPIWRDQAFYWYLDPVHTTVDQLARRPFPKAIAIGGKAVIVAAMGKLAYGPPVALCASSPILTTLPRARVWHRVSNGLLVDQSILEACPPGQISNGPIADAVQQAIVGRPIIHQDERPSWRPQLASLTSGA